MIISHSTNGPQLSSEPCGGTPETQGKSYVLPDLTTICPWPWALNPHYENACQESQKWIGNFNVFSGAKQAFFHASNMSLLSAYAFPRASPAALLACCDWLNFILVVDEYCDESDGIRSRQIADEILDGLKGAPRVGSVFSAICADFRARHFPFLTASAKKRFITSFATYLDNVVRESEFRDQEKLDEDVMTYLSVRRENGGYVTSYTLFDYVQGTDIPYAVHESPIMKRLYNISAELNVILNDLYSYKMEYQRRIADSNLITLFTKVERLSLQEAVNRIGELFQLKVNEFLAEKEKLSRRPFSEYGYGPGVDEGVMKTIESMELLCSGYIRWCLDMPRYFGNDYEEVRQTGIVELHASE